MKQLSPGLLLGLVIGGVLGSVWFSTPSSSSAAALSGSVEGAALAHHAPRPLNRKAIRRAAQGAVRG
jgi:hypothetical protein